MKTPLSCFSMQRQIICITWLKFASYGLFAVMGFFLTMNLRRGENFVICNCNGVKDIVKGDKQYISLGNIYSSRDWGHAKDYVYGMWLMLQQEKPDDFVLATGNTFTVKDFIMHAFRHKGYNLWWRGEGEEEVAYDQNDILRVKIDPKYYRPCEVDLLLGDPRKANKKLGWTRRYDNMDKLIVDMFN